MDWVLSAYESGAAGLPRALMVLGPFMEPGVASALLARAARQSLVTAVTFDAELERPMSEAAAVIAMGGYNTFCEILSFDRPAIIVPRERPRREQWIRAKRSRDLGLVAMLEDPAERGRPRDPAVMADALRRAPSLPPPSAALKPGMLDGLDAVARAAARLLPA